MATTHKPIRHGAVLVAGGAVGAGMFALPLVAAQAWTLWSLLGLVIVGGLTLLAANLLLEVHRQFESGVSFHSLVLRSFGVVPAWLNNLSIAFIMLILMYAYVTAGGRILSATFSIEQESLLKLAFAVGVALVVWLGAAVVSRLSFAIVIFMALSFSFVAFNLVPFSSPAALSHTALVSDASNAWLLIPVFVTAFACGGIVPTLVDYYRGDIGQARRAVRLGLLLTFLVYCAWLLLCFATLGQDTLVQLHASNAGMSDLLAALKSLSNSDTLLRVLNVFSHMAVITSFLSVALGLVHFIQDRLNLSKSSGGRGLATTLAFGPPVVASLLAPYGFVQAIAYAGFFVAISFFIVPACLYIKHYRVSLVAMLVFVAGVFVILFKALS